MKAPPKGYNIITDDNYKFIGNEIYWSEKWDKWYQNGELGRGHSHKFMVDYFYRLYAGKNVESPKPRFTCDKPFPYGY